MVGVYGGGGSKVYDGIPELSPYNTSGGNAYGVFSTAGNGNVFFTNVSISTKLTYI